MMAPKRKLTGVYGFSSTGAVKKAKSSSKKAEKSGVHTLAELSSKKKPTTEDKAEDNDGNYKSEPLNNDSDEEFDSNDKEMHNALAKELKDLLDGNETNEDAKSVDAGAKETDKLEEERNGKDEELAPVNQLLRFLHENRKKREKAAAEDE